MYILYWLNIGHHKNCFKQKKSCVKNKKILRALYVHDMKVRKQRVLRRLNIKRKSLKNKGNKK